MKKRRIVELQGDIFDSLRLTSVLDEITSAGATGVIKNIKIGNTPEEGSYVRIVIHAEDEKLLDALVESLKRYGAEPLNIYVKTIELKGHIIDSLTLSKVLDIISIHGGRAEILDVKIGMEKKDLSYAKIKIITISKKNLDAIYEKVIEHGATLTEN